MHRYHFVLITIGFLTHMSHAAAYQTLSSEQGDPVSFWVYIDQTKSDWDIGNTKARTEVSRYGVAFTQHFSTHFQAGLFGGYTSMTQKNYTRTAGLTLTGAHLGLILRAFPLKTEKFDIDTGASLSYNQTDDDISNRSVETDWIESLVYIKGILKLKPVHISIGANYQHINGTENFNSTGLNLSSDVKAEDNVSGMAGIDLLTGNGTIGLRGEWGARNSIYLNFANDF